MARQWERVDEDTAVRPRFGQEPLPSFEAPTPAYTYRQSKRDFRCRQHHCRRTAEVDRFLRQLKGESRTADIIIDDALVRPRTGCPNNCSTFRGLDTAECRPTSLDEVLNALQEDDDFCEDGETTTIARDGVTAIPRVLHITDDGQETTVEENEVPRIQFAGSTSVSTSWIPCRSRGAQRCTEGSWLLWHPTWCRWQRAGAAYEALECSTAAQSVSIKKRLGDIRDETWNNVWFS